MNFGIGGFRLIVSSDQSLTIRFHVSANFLRIASRLFMARCARDVLSRDAPRATGCSRSANFCVLKKLSGTDILAQCFGLAG